MHPKKFRFHVLTEFLSHISSFKVTAGDGRVISPNSFTEAEARLYARRTFKVEEKRFLQRLPRGGDSARRRGMKTSSKVQLIFWI